MLVKKISKMGSQMRVIYLPSADFRWGQLVRLTPRGKGYSIVRKVSKMGKNLLVTIPRAEWLRFSLGKFIYIMEETK
jgi:hypothetical protein